MRHHCGSRFVLLCLTLSLNTACSINSDRALSAPDTLDTKSCVFTASEGPQAAISALGTKEIVRTFFDKEYNFSYLRAIGHASVVSSIDFINKTDVTLYKAKELPTSGCSANLFEGLKSMPSDLQRGWGDDIEADADGSFILGLYLSKSPSWARPSLNNSAAIIIRKNTNRWTLVHEFMHHLFQLRAAEQGYDDDQARLEFSASIKAFNEIEDDKKLTDHQKAIAMVPAYERYAKALKVILTHYFLEEITIEATLKDLNKTGDLGFAPVSSNWYIQSSVDKVTNYYLELTRAGDGIKKKLEGYAGREALAYRILVADVSIGDLFTQATKISDKYPIENRINGILGFDFETHEGCAHSDHFDQDAPKIQTPR